MEIKSRMIRPSCLMSRVLLLQVAHLVLVSTSNYRSHGGPDSAGICEEGAAVVLKQGFSSDELPDSVLEFAYPHSVTDVSVLSFISNLEFELTGQDCSHMGSTDILCSFKFKKNII
jgi:hypothetical protein